MVQGRLCFMMSQDAIYSIGEIARAAGVEVSTVRYYERRGLLRPRRRRANNYREYGSAALDRLRFIGLAKAAGLTLGDTESLVGIDGQEAGACARVQQLIGERLSRIDEQIEQLGAIRRILVEWLGRCAGLDPDGPCPVLDGLHSSAMESAKTMSKQQSRRRVGIESRGKVNTLPSHEKRICRKDEIDVTT